MLENGRIWNILFKALLVLVLSASLFSGSLVFAKGGSSPDLLSDAGDINGTDIGSQPEYVIRSRLVNINQNTLLDASGMAKDTAKLSEIRLNLFPDAVFIGVVKNVSRGETNIWSGTLKNGGQGYFIVVNVGDAYTIHVGSVTGIYEVSNNGSGQYQVMQIDQSKLGEDASTEMDPPGPVLKKSDLQNAADNAGTLDVMVVYTAAARTAAGGSSSIKSNIATAIAQANAAYGNAGVTPRLRLVHTDEVVYTESGVATTDLTRLVSATDTYMDNVHTLRKTYGADMVGLIVENAKDDKGNSTCGQAKAIMAAASNAFMVTVRPGCLVSNYTLAHEFAHLQGAHHDTWVDNINTNPNGYNKPYAYGHGYVHFSSTVAADRWRTIMAYDDLCQAFKYSCTRLQYFSNPTKNWRSTPMGTVGTSEVYKVLNTTAQTVANFATTLIGTDFSSPFTANSSGWTPVYSTWALTGSNYYYTNGTSGYYASTKHSGTYGDLTYTVKMKRTGSNIGDGNYMIIRGNPATLTSTKDWKSSYQFGYNNNGSYSVWRISSTGAATALKTWTSSSAIVKNNYNTLSVVAVGSSLKFSINGTVVYTGTDTTFSTGVVGISMYRTSGSTSNVLYVDSAVLTNSPTADIKVSADAFQVQNFSDDSALKNSAP